MPGYGGKHRLLFLTAMHVDWHFCRQTSTGSDRRHQPRARRPRAAVLPALRTRSRAGKARRSVPLRASSTPIRSRAWGSLRFFAASARDRPAARTSPPSEAGLGVGAPAGLGRGIRLTRGGSTRNDLVRNIVERLVQRLWVGIAKVARGAFRVPRPALIEAGLCAARAE